MNASNSVMHGPWSILLIAIVALLALGQVPSAGAAESAAPLDLASVMLTPDEIASAGFAGLGFDDGRTLQAQDLADRAVWPAGDGPERDTLATKLSDAGFVQGYAARATTIRDPAASAAITDVEWEVDAYADPAGASTGFALVPDTYPTGPQTPEAGSRTFGDASRITRVDARDPQSGFATAELALGFRTGAVTAFVLVRTPDAALATIAQIERLAGLLLAKVDAAISGAPGLSALALRVEPVDEQTVRSDAYLRYAGRDARSAYETEADFTARIADYGNALDVFRLQTELPAAGGDYALEYASALYRFADPADASAWLAQEPDRFRTNPVASEVNIEPDANLGDESFAATLTTAPGANPVPIRWAVVAVRVGNVVAETQLWRVYQAPSLADALALARQQTACLHAGECPSPASLPAGA